MPLLSTPFPPFHFVRPKPLSSKRVSNQTHLSSPNQSGPPPLSPDQLELHEKPSPSPVSAPEPETRQSEPDLTPFLNLFSNNLSSEETPYVERKSEDDLMKKEVNGAGLAYYDPKPGEFLMGVVVSGDENKVEVDLGSDKLGIMLKKEIMPLFDEEMEDLSCDLGQIDGYRGKIGIVRDEMAKRDRDGNSVVEIGTVIFAEALGRTLGGRPVISARRLFRRLAWHRVRQIMHLKEPIEVRINEWNTGGLLARIEGLRAFLPKVELMTRINNFTDYKNNVGKRIHVCIIKIDEATNDVIISERQAWEKIHLKEGTILQGKVAKIFPFGAQIRIGETNRNGLLHISSISKDRIESVNDVLKINEEIKMLVVNSMFPDKIALSIAELESEPGLFLRNKKKVFEEAEEMAKKYRQKLPTVKPKLGPAPVCKIPFENESKLYSNFDCFKFEPQIEANLDEDDVSNVEQ
ncbi:hypothetical protein LUZ60_000409 [Juncus effusus]|nr:hypothetical protein LUZ60_000409 [Juncus effusus]